MKKVVKKSNTEHSGIMVCLYLPAKLQKKLAIKGGEKPESLHVTLAYIPKLGGNKAALKSCIDAVKDAAKEFGAVTGTIGQAGVFPPSETSDFKEVLYAQFNSPTIGVLREKIVEELAYVGCNASTTHAFRPHITLAYLDPGAPVYELNTSLGEAEIGKISIVAKGNRTDVALSTKVKKSQPTSSSVHVPSIMREEDIMKAAFDTENLNPPVNNLEAAVVKDDAPRIAAGMNGDSNALDGLYNMQEVVSGIDYEMEVNAIGTPEDAEAAAVTSLEGDPDYYKKKWLEIGASDEPIQKDTEETEESPLAGTGLRLDLGSGQCREAGHIGLDLYPYDHGTVIHDVTQGLPFPDESANRVRLVNALDDMEMRDPKPLLSEIQRVLMPGGQFHYEGPNEIFNFPEWLDQTDRQVLVNKSEDGAEAPSWAKQTFTRLAMPDPATANDAEPRIGVSQYDMLPADALLAMDALGYYWSDATSSGRGNRLHGYPSQGALVGKSAPSKARGSKESRQPTVSDSPSPVKFSKKLPIMKIDKAQQIVYGVVLAPDESDLQDDIMSADEIEIAAHKYLQDYRVIGSSHTKPIAAKLAESYIAPVDFDMDGQHGPQTVKKGSWVAAVKILDPAEWEKVVNGEYQGFSVGGQGLRDPIAET